MCCVRTSKTGLYQSTDLGKATEKFCSIKGPNEHSGLHDEGVWSQQDSSYSWTSDRAPALLCRGKTTISAPLHQSGLCGREARRKLLLSKHLPGVCQKAPKRLSDHEKQNCLVGQNKGLTLWSECSADTRLLASTIPTAKHGCGSILLQAYFRVERKTNAAM